MRLSFIAGAAYTLAALTLTACAAAKSSAQHENQPHIPPPDFSVSEDIRTCGVRGGSLCDTGEFCRRAIGDICGAADAPGICSPIPVVCTQEYAPVCGCDGKTYSTECTANSQSVSAAYAGECKT